MTSETVPFVLRDDARPGGRAVLYSEPAEIIQTRDPADVRACLIIDGPERSRATSIAARSEGLRPTAKPRSMSPSRR